MEIVDENGNSQRQFTSEDSKRVIAGVFGIILGELGIHKFILGYTKEGLIQILITFCTCGIAGLIGKIEGIVYLTKSDEEFVDTYQNNYKGWF